MDIFPYTFDTPRNGSRVTVASHDFDNFKFIFASKESTEKYLKGRIEVMVDIYYALIETGLLFRSDLLIQKGVIIPIPKVYMFLKSGQENELISTKKFEYPLDPSVKKAILEMSGSDFVVWFYKEIVTDSLTYQYGAMEHKVRAINKVRSLSDSDINKVKRARKTKIERVVKEVPVAVTHKAYEWECAFLEELIKRYDELINSTLNSTLLNQALNLFSVTLIYEEYMKFMAGFAAGVKPCGKNKFKEWVIDVCCINGTHPKQQVQTHNTYIKGIEGTRVRDYYHFKTQKELMVVLNLIR